MRKLRFGRMFTVLAVFAALSLHFTVIPASAGVNGTDPTGDIFDKNLVYRQQYAKCGFGQSAVAKFPCPDFLDITNWSFDTQFTADPRWEGGKIIGSITTKGLWPRLDQKGSVAGLPAGTNEVSIRWVFQTGNSQTQAPGMHRRQIAGITCTDKRSGVPDPTNIREGSWHPITFDKVQCYDVDEGPFFQSDGWSFFIVLDLRQRGADVIYDWGMGWFGELEAVFYSYPGRATHMPQAGTTLADHISVVQNLGGDGTAGTADDRSTITLTTPYKMRADAGDDHDGVADETRAWEFMRSGDLVTRVTVGTYSTVQASIPEEPVCPFTSPLPPDLQDPDECIQQGVGLTGIADWNGNPFSKQAQCLEVTNVYGVLLNLPTYSPTQCGPQWGGFMPRNFPRAQAWLPGAGSATCPYPAGFLVSFGNSLDVKDLATLGKGATIDPVPPDGGGTFRVVPILNDDPNSAYNKDYALPTGQAKACGYIYDNNGLHFLDSTLDFLAA